MSAIDTITDADSVNAALRKYGVHTPTCDRDQRTPDACPCGFTQALAGAPYLPRPTDARGGAGVYSAELAALRARLATAETLIRHLMQAADRAGFGVFIQPTPDNMPMINLLDDLGWSNPFVVKEPQK